MKFSFALSIFLVASSSLFATAELPDRLSCSALSCVYGDAAFCNVEELLGFSLSQIRSGRPQWEGDSAGRLSTEDDKVLLDFSDGDQVSKLTFRKEDALDLSLGKKATLPGTYEDGYYWADGYHTRALFALSCTR